MPNNDIYLGNPLLKRANTQIEFTEEQIIEFLKCKEDPVYFAKNYIKIVSLDHGLARRVNLRLVFHICYIMRYLTTMLI
jgi:hypothetical protein